MLPQMRQQPYLWYYVEVMQPLYSHWVSLAFGVTVVQKHSSFGLSNPYSVNATWHLEIHSCVSWTFVSTSTALAVMTQNITTLRLVATASLLISRRKHLRFSRWPLTRITALAASFDTLELPLTHCRFCVVTCSVYSRTALWHFLGCCFFSWCHNLLPCWIKIFFYRYCDI